MKKIFIFLSAITVVSFLSTSCNKKLKENMEELENSLNEEKSQTETLQGQVNAINSIIVKSPVAVSFSATDYNDAAVSYSANYSFAYGSDYSYSFVADNQDGTYMVYIWRGGDLGTDFGIQTVFTYNPTTKAVSNIYFSLWGYTSSGIYYNPSFNGTSEITHNLTVTAFDFNAGTVSFNYTGTTTAAYGSNAFGNPMTLTASYSGSLAKYYEAVPL